jgi:cyclopropane-fatty-acyl-phospholipid synthase
VHLGVRSEDALARLVLRGDVGAGEAYVDGAWDADDLPGFLSRLLTLAAMPAAGRQVA